MYMHSIFDLTDENLEFYKYNFEDHIREDIQDTIGTFIGLKIDFSLDWESEYFTGLDLAWKIARGEDEYMDNESNESKLRRWKDTMETAIKKNDNADMPPKVRQV